jgi:transcriptional regulator with XRE-family HTH domain
VPSIHEPAYIELITRLRYARKAKNLTQAQLAEKLRELQSYVAKVETCERRLDVIEAAKWCIALGITLNEVIPAELKSAFEQNASHYHNETKDDDG